MYSSSLACGNLESSKQSSFSGLFCQLSGTESWRVLGMLKDSGLIFTQITKYRQIQHQQHEISFFYLFPDTLECFTVTYSYMNMPLDRVENGQVTLICTNLYPYAWTPTISCDLEVFLTMGARYDPTPTLHIWANSCAQIPSPLRPLRPVNPCS